MPAIVTHHAFERGKERLGFNKQTLQKMADIALEKGKAHKECRAKLRKYIDKIYLTYNTANNIRIYGEVIYLFRFDVLLTVYLVPVDLRRYLAL